MFAALLPAVPTAAQTATTTYRTVQLMAAPDYLGGVPIGAAHPPEANSATARAIHRDLAAELTRRGYVVTTGDADLMVYCHLALPTPDDPTSWDAGYVWRPQWARDTRPEGFDMAPQEYGEGSLIIDLVDAQTGGIVWRGHGVTPLQDDAFLYARELARTVRAVLADVPPPEVLSHRSS